MNKKDLTPTTESLNAGGNTCINGGYNATAIGTNATAIITGLNGAFVLELLAAKDRQINELLNIIERLKNGANTNQE